MHNVIDGELNSIEIESIKNIIEIFGDKKVFFNSSVFVASHIDQLNNELEQEEILTLINNQIKGIFDEEFSHVIGVNSVGYIKGIKENKTLLKKNSNIDNLKNILLEMIKEEKSCFNYGIKNSINSINIKIDDKINILEEITNEEKVDFINIDEVKEDINSIRNDVLSAVKYTLPEYNFWFNRAFLISQELHYSNEYKSRYKAENEWKEVSKKIIEKFVLEGRKERDKIVNYYEDKISVNSDLNKDLVSSFNKIKKIYYDILKNNQKDVNVYSLNFYNVERNDDLDDAIINARRELRQLDIEDFPPLNQYMSIKTIVKYEETIFSRGDLKDVKYYKWTIRNEEKNIVNEYEYVLRDKVEGLYKEYEEPYRSRVTSSVNEFNCKVDLILDDIQNKVNDINNTRKEKIEFIQNIDENINTLKEKKDCLNIFKEEIEERIEAEKKLERERTFLEQKNYYIMLNNKNLNDLSNKECVKKSIIELEEGINSEKYITQESKDYLQKLKLKLIEIEKYEQDIKIKDNLEKENKPVKKIEKKVAKKLEHKIEKIGFKNSFVDREKAPLYEERVTKTIIEDEGIEYLRDSDMCKIYDIYELISKMRFNNKSIIEMLNKEKNAVVEARIENISKINNIYMIELYSINSKNKSTFAKEGIVVNINELDEKYLSDGINELKEGDLVSVSLCPNFYNEGNQIICWCNDIRKCKFGYIKSHGSIGSYEEYINIKNNLENQNKNIEKVKNDLILEKECLNLNKGVILNHSEEQKSISPAKTGKLNHKNVKDKTNKLKQNETKLTKKVFIIFIVIALIVGIFYFLNKPKYQENNYSNNINKSSNTNESSLSNNSIEEDSYIEENEAYLNYNEVSQQELIDLIDELEYSYDEAINTGNVSLTYPYLTDDGILRKSYDKNIPEWHDEGMNVRIVDTDYYDFEQEEAGKYRIARVSVTEVNRNGDIRYEQEYIEFIIVQDEDGNLLVDTCENYSMLDDDYNY